MLLILIILALISLYLRLTNWIYNSNIYQDFTIECGNDNINYSFKVDKLISILFLLLIFELELVSVLHILINILNYNVLLVIILYLFSIIEISMIGK